MKYIMSNNGSKEPKYDIYIDDDVHNQIKSIINGNVIDIFGYYKDYIEQLNDNDKSYIIKNI